MFISPEVLKDAHVFENAIWRMLARGVVDAKHAYRLGNLATVNSDGKPDTRTVVLRACNKPNRSLSFHTDIRSQKVAHFHHQPEVCMHFWDHKESLQLRVYGKVTIHHLNEVAAKKVENLPANQKELFGYSIPPGSVLSGNETVFFQEDLVKQHFAWITIAVESIDALHLGRTGIHTRARFFYQDGQLRSADYLKS
jgi:hypothetical protein